MPKIRGQGLTVRCGSEFPMDVIFVTIFRNLWIKQGDSFDTSTTKVDLQ
ncbi:MAG: hypothetical protein PHQ60_12530 [Sideroxydans sp.]|nr:hypothetical protein [Sideroxydans sp.]